MRIVIALADSALHKRGEKVGVERAAHNVRAAAAQLARVADGNDLVIVCADGHAIGADVSQARDSCVGDGVRHGAGGGLTDVRVADQLELELRHCLPSQRSCATLVTMVEVDRADPALKAQDEPNEPVLSARRDFAAGHSQRGGAAHHGIGYRRVGPSPQPIRLLESEALRQLIAQGAVVICTRGCIPVVAAADGGLHSVAATVDPYGGAALVAEAVQADRFVIATEMAGVFLDWGTANSKLLRHGHPSALREFTAAAGAMGPKLQAASRFAERTGRRAAIGALTDVARLVEGTSGTTISCERIDPRCISNGSIAC